MLYIPNMAPATGGDQVTGTLPPKRHEKGWTLSIPFWSKSIREVDEGMRKYIWMAFAIGVALVLIVIFIIMGAFLSPGVIDPETGKVRFVSDGFKVRAVSVPSSTCQSRHHRGRRPLEWWLASSGSPLGGDTTVGHVHLCV